MTAVISCQQPSTADENENLLLTTDENENQAIELKFGTSINISVYIQIPVKFFFISAVISCQQPSTADDS